MNFNNEYVLIAALLIFIISVFLTSYAVVRLIRRTRYISISIDKIQPYFSYGSPMKTGSVECSFKIDTKKSSSYLSEVVPINYFLGTDEGFIIFDIGIDLPVLYTSGEKVIGEEAIEHFLLQNKSILTIKFISGNYTPGEYRGNLASKKSY
ncbi:MAG: hypothetical protein OEZ34_07620 [Spirochaetia bacterium]|nr:hypothetical protein [Spirochaetia bacterium]